MVNEPPCVTKADQLHELWELHGHNREGPQSYKHFVNMTRTSRGYQCLPDSYPEESCSQQGSMHLDLAPHRNANKEAM
jgi:hypothetical protein